MRLTTTRIPLSSFHWSWCVVVWYSSLTPAEVWYLRVQQTRTQEKVFGTGYVLLMQSETNCIAPSKTMADPKPNVAP